jgi:hypothetical protein
MLHLAQQPVSSEAPAAYAEAVSRLASIRHALRMVEPSAGGPAGDPTDEEVARAWDWAPAASQRLFDRRSARTVGAAAAGVEALLIERQEGRQPNAAASQALVDEIRRELREIASIILA